MRDTPWQDKADEIDERRKQAKRGGGDDAIRKQHARDRLTIRERIDRMLDEGSLRETGPIAGAGERNDDVVRRPCGRRDRSTRPAR